MLYYRAGWPCSSSGWNTCFADTPTAINREHAILGADRCVALNPSDSAPALIALDAKFVIRTPKGERVVNAEDYFIGPGTDITRMNNSGGWILLLDGHPPAGGTGGGGQELSFTSRKCVIATSGISR